jgi:hypothetical protein
MNGMERSLLALSMKQYDHVSPNPEIDLAYAAKIAGFTVGECFLDEIKHADALNSALDRHDVDGHYINLSLDKGSITKKETTPSGWLVTDDIGNQWAVSTNDIGTIVKRDIKTLEDERIFDVEPIFFGNFKVLDAIDKNHLAERMVCCGLTGAYSQVVFLIGIENALFAMIDEPEQFKKAIHARQIKALKRAVELVEHGANFIWIGEGLASSSVISPGQYQEFVLPFETELANYIRNELQVPVVTHICGDINKSIQFIAQNGSNGLDVDYMVDLNFAYQATAGQICLKGNINPVDLLTMSQTQVFDLCRQKLVSFPHDRGLILSTGCLVCRDTPPENIDAFVCACVYDKI